MKYLSFIIIIILVGNGYSQEQNLKPRYDIFTFDKQVTLPGTPEQIFDAATGDISG